MQLNKEKWDKYSYLEFINFLKENKDEKYKNFHQKLLNDDINLIGIRTPILQKISKEISKGNYLEFIKNINHNYYEETIIHGLIIGNLKLPLNEIFNLLDDFLKYNTNWAINDIVAAKLKVFNKNNDECYSYIQKLINSNNSFNIRFGLVLLLDHYINDNYIDEILKIVSNVKDDNYYVMMALAWLISICYIKYKDKTIKIIKNKSLNKLVHNKAIKKIIESKRVSIDEKTFLRDLKV